MMYVCMFICMNLCTYVLYVCIYICMCVCIYMYVYIYVCTYIGTDYQKVGVRMFNSLVELDCAPSALIVLDKLMRFNNDRLELLFSSNTDLLKLSDLAKEKIYKYLYNLSIDLNRNDNNKYIYRTSDLILSLYCFNREDKKSNYYRLLESIGHYYY